MAASNGPAAARPARRRPDAAFGLLVIGSLLALYFAAIGFSAFGACAAIGNLACFGLATLIALPAITGAVSLAMAFVLYTRPARHRAVGAVAVVLSATSVAVILVEFAAYPQALEFVLVLYAWPVLLTLTGGILALVWRSPDGAAHPSISGAA